MTVTVNTPYGAIPLLRGGAESYVRFFEQVGNEGGRWVPIAAGIDVVGEFVDLLDDWRAEGSDPEELPARVAAWAEVCSGVVSACDVGGSPRASGG